jgi:hypothetical protein
MDQNKNTQGQQGQGQNQGQQGQGQQQGSQSGQERGAGKQGEKNSSGISNRGMSEDEEQADLPRRGSSDQSER